MASLVYDQVVWADLGHSFGWWPARYVGNHPATVQARKERLQKLEKMGKDITDQGEKRQQFGWVSLEMQRFSALF